MKFAILSLLFLSGLTMGNPIQCTSEDSKFSIKVSPNQKTAVLITRIEGEGLISKELICRKELLNPSSNSSVFLFCRSRDLDDTGSFVTFLTDKEPGILKVLIEELSIVGVHFVTQFPCTL